MLVSEMDTQTPSNNEVGKNTSQRSASKGNVQHCLSENGHSTEGEVERDEGAMASVGQRTSFPIPSLIAPSNDIVRQVGGRATRPADCPVPAQIRVRYRHLLDALTPALLERHRARFIKSAKRIAPSSSSFGGNKEQWAVIQPRNESGDGGGERGRVFLLIRANEPRRGLNGSGIKAFTLVSFRILILHTAASPDINTTVLLKSAAAAPAPLFGSLSR